jgi:hypothetical protein
VETLDEVMIDVLLDGWSGTAREFITQFRMAHILKHEMFISRISILIFSGHH